MNKQYKQYKSRTIWITVQYVSKMSAFSKLQDANGQMTGSKHPLQTLYCQAVMYVNTPTLKMLPHWVLKFVLPFLECRGTENHTVVYSIYVTS